MLAPAAAALYLVVRLYDMHGVPPDALAAARAATGRILADADIEVRWADCPCEAPVGPAELMIRVSDATAMSDAASLGFSFVDLDRRSGTLATIFADRIHALALAAHVDEGELLGRAMAHELAHLLSGTRDHDVAGLMRGTWTTFELAANRPGDWRFSSGDGVRLRQALARRIRPARDPAMRVASARGPDQFLNAP